MEKVISIFGTARSKEGDPHYEEARELGKRLAEKGFTVSSGGFAGAMEAVSRGAYEAGGRVIGVTFKELTSKFSPNRWIHEVIDEADLFSRIKRLTTAQGLIAVSGGIGTLAEVSIAWNLMQTGGMPAKPLILLGERWKRMSEYIREQLIVHEEDMMIVAVVNNIDEAITVLEKTFDGKRNL